MIKDIFVLFCLAASCYLGAYGTDLPIKETSLSKSDASVTSISSPNIYSNVLKYGGGLLVSGIAIAALIFVVKSSIEAVCALLIVYIIRSASEMDRHEYLD